MFYLTVRGVRGMTEMMSMWLVPEGTVGIPGSSAARSRASQTVSWGLGQHRQGGRNQACSDATMMMIPYDGGTLNNSTM